MLDQEGLIIVTRNSAFICRVKATDIIDYNICLHGCHFSDPAGHAKTSVTISRTMGMTWDDTEVTDLHALVVHVTVAR